MEDCPRWEVRTKTVEDENKEDRKKRNGNRTYSHATDAEVDRSPCALPGWSTKSCHTFHLSGLTFRRRRPLWHYGSHSILELNFGGLDGAYGPLNDPHSDNALVFLL